MSDEQGIGRQYGSQDKAHCSNCDWPINTGTFKQDGFKLYCGACGYVEALREIGADDATLRSAERAAARTRANREAVNND